MDDKIKDIWRDCIADAKELWFDRNDRQIIFDLALHLFEARFAILLDAEEDDVNEKDDDKDDDDGPNFPKIRSKIII